MADHVYINTAPAGRAAVRITVDAKKAGKRVLVSVDYDRSVAEALVRDLCRDAGLPEPWQKG